MTTTVTKNCPPRKQLSDQIDRLDGVIDALDEGLKGAVSDAVRDAVGAAVNEAVQAVLLELLTNAELQKAVRHASAPAEPAPNKNEEQQDKISAGSLLSRLLGRVRSAARSCAAGVRTAFNAARRAWQFCGSKARSLVLAAGAAAAGAAYACRGKIVSAATAACGAAKSLLASAGRRLGRLVPALAG
jgi:hypothetical protein